MTPDAIEAAAYALWRFDAQRHPIKMDEKHRWIVWGRVAPTYRKRAELALLAAANPEPPVKPTNAHNEGENLVLAL